MTEQIKNRIEKATKHLGSIPFGRLNTKQGESVEMAIRSLQSWEEVLQELEILIRGCNILLEDNNEDMFYGGKKRAYEKVIEVINQKLAENEE